ncbi:MAG: cupin domain-containing protein [Coriobacteriia bacterium]|nr:cupin domain-containing protein [Coriobacteriia bacterium]
MNVLLTSTPFSYDGPERVNPRVNPANGFCQALRRCWPNADGTPRPASCVLVASNPDCPPMTDGMAANFSFALEQAGLPVQAMPTLDNRNADRAEQLISTADVVILTGGHVPTQNAFFQAIGLRDLLHARCADPASSHQLILGISAGSMNSAAQVYAMPEEPGEATDPNFARFLDGLGLTDISVIPHYGFLKDETLDDLPCMEGIAYLDSAGRRFLVIPDGTYLSFQWGENAGTDPVPTDQVSICGTAWWLADGRMTPAWPDPAKLQRAHELADQLGMIMQEDGEGTLFVRTYESAQLNEANIPVVSTMYGLYCAEPLSLSRFHRLTCDETWCHFEGDPLELHLISPDGSYDRVTLGQSSPGSAPRYQHTIPAGTWQAGRLVEGGTFALYSCVVSPSFHDGCYEGATAEALQALCSDPAAAVAIRDLA